MASTKGDGALGNASSQASAADSSSALPAILPGFKVFSPLLTTCRTGVSGQFGQSALLASGS